MMVMTARSASKRGAYAVASAHGACKRVCKLVQPYTRPLMSVNNVTYGMHAKPCQRNARRGVIGIESAIVLIAFVMVAAALSFVILNMGFSTTQRAKVAIQDGLAEASSAMEMTGSVLGKGNTTANKLDYIAIPIKVSPGGDSVNLEKENVAIRYYTNKFIYDTTYKGIIKNGTYSTPQQAYTLAKNLNYINQLPGTGAGVNSTSTIIYFTVNKNNNPSLDTGENAIVLVMFNYADRPAPLDNFNTEVIVPTGALLSVQRQVPSISDTVVDLG